MSKFSASVSFEVCDACDGPIAEGEKGFPISPLLLDRDLLAEASICKECLSLAIDLFKARKGVNLERAKQHRSELVESLKVSDPNDPWSL